LSRPSGGRYLSPHWHAGGGIVAGAEQFLTLVDDEIEQSHGALLKFIAVV